MGETTTRSFRVGDHVRLNAPGGWFDGKTGRIHHFPSEFPDSVTVELDEGGRALANLDRGEVAFSAPERNKET